MIHCLHCGAETTNGLALCELCQRKVATDLEYLPIYFRNLARWRPGRTGSRQVPGSRVLYDGSIRDVDSTGDKISDKLAEALTMLTTWARALIDDRPHYPRPLTLADAVLTGDLADEYAERLVDNPGETATALCLAFWRHLTSLSTLDWCGQFVRDIGRHEATLRTLCEKSAPGWYAGACRHCTVPTHVLPGFTWVTCQGCGATTHVGDHLEIILEEARDWIAPPMRIAEALVALIDTEQSARRLHKRIVKWGDRAKVTPIRQRRREHVYDLELDRIVIRDEEVGHARYRFGEVLDLLVREGATRVERRSSQKSAHAC